jgi:hypothetical protein
MSTPDAPLLLEEAIASCDAAYLRALREAVDMDIMVLARKACLSAGQIRELESGIHGRYFYSETIKRQAYKRVLTALGVTLPPQRALTSVSNVLPSHDAGLKALDLLADMSHRPSLSRPIVHHFRHAIVQLQKHKQVMGAFLLLLLALVGLAIYGPQRHTADHPMEENRLATTSPPSAPSARLLASAAVVQEAKTPLIAQPIVAAPAMATASAPPSAAETVCAFTSEAMPQITPSQAYKEGRYVHLVSTTDAQVCVVDAQKHATLLQMKAGESKSVYGMAPWQISSSHLQQIKIYFQGALVVLPSDTSKRLSLSEASAAH